MTCFVWHRVRRVSNNYHPEGGVLIIAKHLERAHEMAEEKGVDLRDEDYGEPRPAMAAKGWSASPDEPLPPDWTYFLDGEYEEKLITFPDAGCC